MERDIAGAADRLLTLLTLLQNSTGITVSEAAEKIGVNRSNAYRSLRKLEEYGFAAKTGRKYAAGPRLMPDSFLTPYAVAQYSGTIMKELVMTTGIGAHLCMISPHGATFIRQEVSSDMIQVSQPVGKEEPFFCTASGKVMLAYLPEELRLKIIDRIVFQSFTERTITSKEELFSQIRTIREQGYATDEGEFHPNIGCICVPVFDARHFPRYSLGLSKPLLGGDTLDYPKLKKVLDRSAARIEAFLTQESSSYGTE